jgi:meiotically up-regulated gene 157 (Mug157) protein
VYHNIDRIVYPQTAKKYASIIRSSVKGHLKWALNLAQRPHGYWHRSYLATGTPKDGPVFQLDQQCYPILELCDFLEAFPSESTFVQNLLEGAAIPSVLAIIKELQDNTTGLYPTEETPGDDAVEYPFHFSSHVLLWYTFSRLATIVKSLLEKEPSKTKLALHSSELYHQAAEVRASTFRYFVGENPLTGTTMFAYLTDGNEQHTFYHDANDIPTLLIPAWGFIDRDNSSENALWTNTMDFGLSPANSGGFYPDGPFGGLGSVHTRGPWPLGFAQEYIYSCIRNDAKGRDDALRRIKGSMFWDGLFSEAVDAQTGCCVSKAWFSWPGAMIGSALLKFSNLDSGPKSLI